MYLPYTLSQESTRRPKGEHKPNQRASWDSRNRKERKSPGWWGELPGSPYLLGAEEHQVSLVLKEGSGRPGSEKMKLNTWCVWMNPERMETAESCGWMGGEGGKGKEGKKEILTEEKPLNSHFRSSVQQYWPLPSVLSVLSLQNTEFNETDSLLISNRRQYWGGFGLGLREW